MEQFDHHSEHFAQNWRETYAQLRRECPVAHSDRHGGFTVVTRYEDIKRVLHDPHTFASGRDLEIDGKPTGGVTVPVNPVRMGMMEMDPPESQAYRKLLAPKFSAKTIKEYRPRMAQIVTWTVDRVIDSGRIDFVDDLSNPLPALVSLDLIGLPLGNWERYATVLHKAAYREEGSAREVAWLVDDLRAIVAERSRTAGQHDDVVDRLLTGEVNGAPVDQETVVNLLFMLLNGGIDTSTALIATMFLYLHDQPEQRDRLLAEPELIPTAVDEMLRYFTPGTGVARTVTKPVTLNGMSLQPGDRLQLALGSANNDDEMFPGADQVKLDRDNNSKHLAFGSGIHRCLGAFLAPAEMVLLLEEVLRRMPDYHIDRNKVVAYPTIPLVNGYIAMPASFTPGKNVLRDFDENLPIPRRDTMAAR